MWFKIHYQISIVVRVFSQWFLSFSSLSLFFFPPSDWISVSACNVRLEDKQAQVKQEPASFVAAAARGVRAPSSTVVAAIAPDGGSALESVCSPLPDERQLWTGFSLKIYHGLPREWECKEKSQIKPEPCSPLRRTLFAPYVLQVHFIGIVNWSEIRARFQKAAPKMCPLSTHACELSRRDRSLPTCKEAG